MRPSRRQPDELRAVSLERGVVKYAEGSCFVKFGDTHVLVTATLEDRLPPWLKGQARGWITAEYGMLPRATSERTRREASAGKQTGRTVEIQRLIGRSLRAVLDLEALGERQITVDCDVIQADGGTRTASITGAWVALADCISWMKARNMLKANVLRDNVAAISCGIYNGTPVLDLDYAEDSEAETEETGKTFRANAAIKAIAAAKAAKLPAFADDSGLVVDALDGAPGIYSARWAGPNKDFLAAMTRIERLLQERGATTPDKRRAHFVSALCVAWPDDHLEEVEARVDGTLVWPPRGTAGFGYDPMFLPNGHTRTFGEMTSIEKHGLPPLGLGLSHRARAFVKLAEICLD